MLTKKETGLGPATVQELVGDRLRLKRGEVEVWARLALAYPYQPEPGDLVLTIGEEEIYVIGVLLGRGKTVFETPGDLHLRSRGHVEIEGLKGVEIRSDQVLIKADKVETIARTTFEKTVSCYRWVKELLQTEAGRERKLIDGHYTMKAERIVETADKDVKIDGEQIHLG